MSERRTPGRPTTTVASFIEQAAAACGGLEALARRVRLSQVRVEAMRHDPAPLLLDDAEALLEVFGLAIGSTKDLSD